MPVTPLVDEIWLNALQSEFNHPYFNNLESFLIEERHTQTIYPTENDVFKTLNITPLNKVKVVILGQDPYHGSNQANGLCFSVNRGVKVPPSLKNIYKELKSDIGMEIADHGDLISWAKQGVLLLNSVLTVRKEQAASHKNKGWEKFTDAIIKQVSEKNENVVFLLWGNYAKNKGKHIDLNKHHVLSSAHPSPFSAYNGFLGNKHFSKTNAILTSLNKEPIKWDTLG